MPKDAREDYYDLTGKCPTQPLFDANNERHRRRALWACALLFCFIASGWFFGNLVYRVYPGEAFICETADGSGSFFTNSAGRRQHDYVCWGKGVTHPEGQVYQDRVEFYFAAKGKFITVDVEVAYSFPQDLRLKKAFWKRWTDQNHFEDTVIRPFILDLVDPFLQGEEAGYTHQVLEDAFLAGMQMIMLAEEPDVQVEAARYRLTDPSPNIQIDPLSGLEVSPDPGCQVQEELEALPLEAPPCEGFWNPDDWFMSEPNCYVL